MTVYVCFIFYKFVSGVIFEILEILFSDDFCAE